MKDKNQMKLLAPFMFVMSLGSCAGVSGEVSASAKVEKTEGSINGSGEVSGTVSFGGGGSQGGGRVLTPDTSMIGLCFRSDTRSSDGTITPGAPVPITGAPMDLPPVPAGSLALDRIYRWGANLFSAVGLRPSHNGFAHRILITPNLPDGSLGAENTTIDMTIWAQDTDDEYDRPLLVLSRVERLLDGEALLLPSWAENVTFSSWRRVTSGPNSGNIHLTVGALGAVPQAFQLDLNGVAGYADLTSAQVSNRRPWVVFEVDIDESDVNLPPAPGAWASNTMHIEYATDRTSLTREDHSIDYRIL